MILLGIPFIPCIVGLIICNIHVFKIELFIILLIIIMVYFIIIFILWKLSRRKKYYLLVKNDSVELKFCDYNDDKIQLILPFEQIVKFEYYKINSIKSWLMLYTTILPKCVFITYNQNGEEQTKLIGYLDLKEIKEIAKKTNSKLKIY